jgi:peptidoglycan/LPS O-acetylase OafA/YrhL
MPPPSTPESPAEPAPPPLERNPRYHMLDVWRGVASLMVVLHHAGFALMESDVRAASGAESWVRWMLVEGVRRLNLGVPLFFVISGYCIGASVDATRRRGSSSWAFLGRRIWRIYPPYWAAFALFAAWVGGLGAAGLVRLYQGPYALELWPAGRLTPAQWVGNLTLSELWRPQVFGGEAFVYTRVAWSLCYEEQFYFLCFAVLLLAPRRLEAALGWLTVAITLVTALAWDSGRLPLVEGTFLVRWHQFAIGLLVYWRLNVPGPAARKRAADLLIAAVLLLSGPLRGVFDLITIGGPPPVIFDSTALAAAFGLLLIALRPLDRRAERAAWLGPLRACGRRSYSIYLAHLPFVTALNLGLIGFAGLTGFWTRALGVVPISALASVGACWAFFAVVERHFLNPPIVRRRPEAQTPVHDRALTGEAVEPSV